MFAQTHAFEQFDGIGVQDLPCALARIDSEQDRNQSAHDMGIAVAGKSQHRAADTIRAHSGIEPDLAGAALNLVGIAMRRLRQWRQFAPQLDQIAIAIVPVVQDRKIADDLLTVSHCVQARTLVARGGFLYREQHRAGRYLRGDGEAWTFEDEPGRQAAAKLLSKDEARRIATNVSDRTSPVAVRGDESAFSCISG